MRRLLLPLLLLAGCGSTGSTSIDPVGASQSVPINETDDAAIWVHPTDPAQSLLLIANEKRGLQVHEPNGLLRKHVNDGCKPNNVDLLYGVDLAGTKTDLALASCFDESAPGVQVWRIDPAKRKVIESTQPPIKVFDGTMPLGLCTYQSRKSGKSYFFVTSAKGRIEQYEIVAGDSGTVGAKRVRAFANKAKTEGCVADDERGVVYFAEEDVGVWRFDAEPDGSSEGTLVIKAGEHGMVVDLEGLALFQARGGEGYLLVMSQGAVGGRSLIGVYERKDDNAFITALNLSEPRTGGIERASGLAVLSTRLSPVFPEGMLVVNDHVTGLPTEDMKIYSWADIAKAAGLKSDPAWSPRGR